MIQVVEVRTTQDLQAARDLFGEYAASLEFDLDFQNFEEELATLPGYCCPPRGRVFLALWKGELAGCVALRKLEEQVCEMKRLYVRPRFRGSGIGRVLAETAIEEARSMGYSRMLLDTVASMERARALYTSLGFREVDPYTYNPIDGAVFMELTLA